MAFLEHEQLMQLRIRQMVFHLVGPKPENFVRLEAIDPGRFGGFFLDRIRSINGGLPYVFTDASSAHTRLSRISDDPRVFQRESEALAEDFQQMHMGPMAAGAFLVFRLEAAGQEFFALLKYDDEAVLTYDVEDAPSGRKRVNLESLERTFVQNRDALQKSALIRLGPENGELAVLDRRNQQAVARYFENFLGARRVLDDAQLTERLVDVVRDVIKDNKDLVAPEVVRDVTRRTYNAARAGGHLAMDEHQRFLETVLGYQLQEDDPLLAKYRAALRRARIEASPMTIDPARVHPPRTVNYVTVNNIRIRVPAGMEPVVEVDGDRIIINDRVESQYDDAE